MFQPFQLFQMPGAVEPSEWNGWNGWNFILIRFARPLLFDLFFYFIELHHIAVLVMHIEEVDLVRQRAAIKDAFFDDGDVITE
jgi:hypothetical protein